MANIKEALRAAAIRIRDERKLEANTAERVGSLLLALVEADLSMEDLEKSFLSSVKPDEAAELINFIKGLKVNSNIINRLILKDTEVEEMLDTDVMSALRVLAEIAANNEVLKNMFLRKDKVDSTDYLLRLFGGAVVENGLIVRLPKQDTPAALMSCLLEENEDAIAEEDEDALMEIAPAEISDLSFGGLSNVNSSVDSAPVGSLPVKGENEWSYAAPTLYAGAIDADNMLVPVFDRRTQTMVFIPISAIRGGVTPPPTGFPYTFSFALR